MNFDKHRTSCCFEELPYRNGEGTAYAWILHNPVSIDHELTIVRQNSKPYMQLDDTILAGCLFHPLVFNSERIACKFIGNTMLLYWLKKSYFALIAVVDLSTNCTQLITAEISQDEASYILTQLQAN